MATKVQRKTLWHMIKHGGRALILTGKKSTHWLVEESQDRAIVNGSANLRWGLIANKWVEKDDHPSVAESCTSAYRITAAGVKAAGKREPEMVVAWRGAHGIRWR